MAPTFKKFFQNFAGAAGSGKAAARKAEIAKLAKNIDEAGGVVSPNSLRNADGTLKPESFKALANLFRKAPPDPKNAVKNAKAVSEAVGDAPTKTIADATESSLAQTAKAMKDSDTFFKRNEKALLAAGVTAAGLGAYMLLTGESDPAKAVGKALGSAAGGLGKGLFEGLGLGDFFADWGTYILGFGGFIVFVIFLSFIL